MSTRAQTLIFVSYSHKSEAREPWKARLLEKLKVFSQQGLISAWDDEKIPGGWRWEKEIEHAIHTARLAVILLTKEALESEFILERELKPLNLREKEGLIVIPILCEPCAWKEHEWLRQVQIRPFEAKAISTIANTIERENLLRRLATEIAEELGRRALAALSTPESPDSARTYLDKFPLTRRSGPREEKLIGREQELALHDLAFAQPHTAIVSLVAWGGVGKTMLVQHWLQRLQREGWYGARRVYAWSFYSQGTKEDRQASEDPFLAHALEWFGVHCEPTLSPWDKGRLLADAVARERTLLILDGIEPLQYPPGPMGGQLRAPGVQSLLKHLARKASSGIRSQESEVGNCLCLVTTREPLADLADFQRREGSLWGSVLRVDLGNLTEEAGAALLHHAGANRAGAAEIKSDDKELLVASREVDGHALTLNLLGRFLARAHGGDIRRRDLVKFEEADRKEQGGTTFKMLAAFENWFAKSGEFGARQLAILRMLGLFDRPADAGCITALRKPPVINGLTAPLFHTKGGFFGWGKEIQPLPEEDWNTTSSFLSDFGLVVIQAGTDNNEWLLDCHPLIREHFAKQLRETSASAFTEAHQRIAIYLIDTTPPRPEGIRGLKPLYEAVSHACQAGLLNEACSDIFQQRVRRDEAGYSLQKLGAWGSDLTAIMCFFDHPWNRVKAGLPDFRQAWLLNEAGFCLRALGRMSEAVEPLSISIGLRVAQPNLTEAANTAGNVSELKMMLGDLTGALQAAAESVGFADKSGDFWQIVNRRATIANTLHQLGRRDEAEEFFVISENALTQRVPACKWLFGGQGAYYCDLILSPAEILAWRHFLTGSECSPAEADIVRCCVTAFSQRYEQAVAFASIGGSSLVTETLDEMNSARANFYSTILSQPAVREINKLQAISELVASSVLSARKSGDSTFLPPGLFLRAWVCFLNGNTAGARADLDEAWDIAERGPMRLHMADIHLYRARLFFREKPYPWKSPQDDLAAAEKLINECGYHRRDAELVDAKRAILGSV